MGTLHDKFCRCCRQIGLDPDSLPTAVFYECPVGLRFETDADDEIYLSGSSALNPSYLSNTLFRADTLLKALPREPDLLRIDWWLSEKDAASAFLRMGLPAPAQKLLQTVYEDGEAFSVFHFYWDLTWQHFSMTPLLTEIIRADIAEDGLPLCSSVYLVSTAQSLLYHLYDHRGCDITALEKSLLQPLYQAFGGWILAYDREQIDRLFSDQSSADHPLR